MVHAKRKEVYFFLSSSCRVCKEIGPTVDNFPDPGNYGIPEPIKRSVENHSFSKDIRDKNLSYGPGPGDYTMPNHTEDGPKHTLGGRTPYDKKPLATHTGPGDYNPEKANLSHSYTMGGRPNNNLDKKQPGPGNYEAEDYYVKIKGAGLGKNVRDTSVDLKSVYSPGPGEGTVIR